VPTRQLNIRLGEADRDLLEAIAFVMRVSSASLTRDIVLSYVSVHGSDPGVPQAMEALAIADRASPDAVVRQLHDQ
jgi:hypothetical protein